MRVCAVQTDIVWEDKQANMARCRRFYEQAAGCALVVFPELTLTGFSQERLLCEPPEGASVSFFRELTRGSDTAVCFGYAASEGGRAFNRMCVCAHGEIAAQYDKLHPFTIGGESFSAGERAVCADIAGARVGLTICYDLRFPELTRRLALQGLDILFVLSQWPAERVTQLRSLAVARAIENQAFAVCCNSCGKAEKTVYGGRSFIANPLGEISASAGENEEIISAECDVQKFTEICKKIPVFCDRRPELY